MNRRGFLATLLAAAAGFALDPERAIWTPGKVTTFDLGAMPPRLDDTAGWPGLPIRWDVLYGYSVVRPELACRVNA